MDIIAVFFDSELAMLMTNEVIKMGINILFVVILWAASIDMF